MKNALILGINGTFGSAVARKLAQQGWQIKAMVRHPDKHEQAASRVEYCQGDAARLEDVRRAAQGVDVMVYAVNPPGYDWKDKALPWLEVAAQVAEEKQLSLVFPGNVYVFDPADGPAFSESSPMRALTSKGRIRLAMEQRLQQAAQNGAQIIIVRAGDFIAAASSSSWMQFLLKQHKRGITLNCPGPQDLTHSWAYVPDLAHTIAELLQQKHTLPAFSCFHFEGHRFNFSALAQAISQISDEKVTMKKMPWWPIKLLSPFSPLMHGLAEMSYLWREEVFLCCDKLRDTLGHEPRHTPLTRVLLESGLVKASPANPADTHLETTRYEV